MFVSDKVEMYFTEGQEEFDPRDINRVRDNLNYVYKFAWQYIGDETKAYKLLVCVLLGSIMLLCLTIGECDEMEKVFWS